MFNISGSILFADRPPPPQHTSSGIHADGDYQVVAAQGVFAEFLGWSNV